MPSASYLQPLVAPLRFLAQSDFARLSTVKGLEGLVRTALEGARAARSGTDVQLLERVARALEQGAPETAQEALRALAPRVRDAGVTAGPASPAGKPASGPQPGPSSPTGSGPASGARAPASAPARGEGATRASAGRSSPSTVAGKAPT